jgi:hypothetical protein
MHQEQTPQSQRTNDGLRQVDRSAFCVAGLHDETDEKAYWHTQTPEKRLEAIELNRRTVYGYGDQEAAGRLQRVLEIVERSAS